MEYFCYHRDRPGSLTLRNELLEEHWSYMDRYAKELIARGPTFASDGETPTGSLHIVDLPDPAAARGGGGIDSAVHTGAPTASIPSGARSVPIPRRPGQDAVGSEATPARDRANSARYAVMRAARPAVRAPTSCPRR